MHHVQASITRPSNAVVKRLERASARVQEAVQSGLIVAADAVDPVPGRLFGSKKRTLAVPRQVYEAGELAVQPRGMAVAFAKLVWTSA